MKDISNKRMPPPLVSRNYSSPYFDTADEVMQNRRGFLSLLMGASASLFLATIPFVLTVRRGPGKRFPVKRLMRLSDLSLGRAVPFRYPENSTPALLLRLPYGPLRAFAGTCTHLGCLVCWDAQTRRLLCPCHSGVFDPETGAVLAGPPPQPLPRIELEVRDGVVYAVGVGSS